MPSFKGKLSDAQIDDVIAWLVSMRRSHDVASDLSCWRASLLTANAQVSAERLRDAAREPQNWLTYNGSYASTHHSALTQLRPDNVGRLELKWVWQANSLEKLEATPLVVDGVMYLTDPPNDVVAIDARTGRVFWRYRHPLPPASCRAADVSTADSRCLATLCTWARSTRTWSRSMRAPGASDGTSWLPITSKATR